MHLQEKNKSHKLFSIKLQKTFQSSIGADKNILLWTLKSYALKIKLLHVIRRIPNCQ